MGRIGDCGILYAGGDFLGRPLSAPSSLWPLFRPPAYAAMADRLGARRLPGRPWRHHGRIRSCTGNAFLECGHETTAHRQNYSFRNLACHAIFRPRRTDLEAECDVSYRRFSRHGWASTPAPAPDAPAGLLEARPIGTRMWISAAILVDFTRLIASHMDPCRAHAAS
jgi:hypothetical protein